jgi:hypothetical protein
LPDGERTTVSASQATGYPMSDVTPKAISVLKHGTSWHRPQHRCRLIPPRRVRPVRPYFISRAISSNTSSMWSTSFWVCRADTVHCSS